MAHDEGRRERASGADGGRERSRRAGDDQERNEPRRRSTAEWTTLGVSVAIIAALIGAALYEQFARTEPAGIVIEVEVDRAGAERRDDRWYVPYTVSNRGGDPAMDVSLIFEISAGDEMVEESTATVAFLATSGSTAGELVTALDPTAHEIEARVGSLLRP